MLASGGRRERANGAGRARSHCRFVLPLIHFRPDSLTYSLPLFLKRQCDRTPGVGLLRSCGATSVDLPLASAAEGEHHSASGRLRASSQTLVEIVSQTAGPTCEFWADHLVICVCSFCVKVVYHYASSVCVPRTVTVC
jgi:hypothetical protein